MYLTMFEQLKRCSEQFAASLLFDHTKFLQTSFIPIDWEKVALLETFEWLCWRVGVSHKCENSPSPRNL